MTRRHALSIFAGIFAAGVSNAAEASKLDLKNAKFKTPVKVGFLPITDHLIIVAKELFKSEKFELVPLKFASWADLSEAVRSRALDGAFLLAPLGLMLKASGVKLKAVLAAHKNGSALVARKETASLGDLVGKKVGIPSRFSTHYFLLEKLLGEAGLAGKVSVVDMAPTEMPFALMSRKIDAYIVAEPFGQLAVARNLAKNLVYSKQIAPSHICCVLNFFEDVLAQSGFGEVLDGFKEAAAFVSKNRDEAARLGAKVLGQREKILRYVLEQEIVEFGDVTLKKEDFEQLRAFLVEKKLATKALEGLNLDEYLAV